MALLKVVLSFLILTITFVVGQDEGIKLNCRLPSSIQEEIDAKKSDVDRIVKHILDGPFKGIAYTKLADFVDKFGSRVTGAESLELSIAYMVEYMTNDNLTVTTEQVEIPAWSRGEEHASITAPRPKPLLGLGESVRTGLDGIEAEVLVVTSFTELEQKKAEAMGKIVVFNQPYNNYHTSVEYRTRGANEAAKIGAVAALIRSITPFSLDTPHTGHFFYDNEVTKIPAACITIEDAELLHRLSISI